MINFYVASLVILLSFVVSLLVRSALYSATHTPELI